MEEEKLEVGVAVKDKFGNQDSKMNNARNQKYFDMRSLKIDTDSEKYQMFERIAIRIVERFSMMLFLYYLLDRFEGYNMISYCLYALAYISECYRKTLDRNGSILLFVLLLIPILSIFNMRPSALIVFMVTFLTTTISMFIQPFFSVQKCMTFKCAADEIVAFIMLKFSKSYVLSSRATDLLLVPLFVFYEMWCLYKSDYHNRVADTSLVIIFLGHTLIFYLELFTINYFCFLLVLTVSWMYLKSLFFPEKTNLLTLKFDKD